MPRRAVPRRAVPRHAVPRHAVRRIRQCVTFTSYSSLDTLALTLVPHPLRFGVVVSGDEKGVLEYWPSTPLDATEPHTLIKGSVGFRYKMDTDLYDLAKVMHVWGRGWSLTGLVRRCSMSCAFYYCY